VMMLAYTIIFSGIFVLSRNSAPGGFGSRSLLIFSGITLFSLFTELLYRAPGLLHEHASFIKKSIFPTETLAWIAVLRALVYAGISFGVLVIFELLMTRHLPLTALLTPLLVIPLVMLLLGFSWFLMALGAYTRDITHLMGTIVPVLMWVTPVFYSTADVPGAGRFWMRLNIIGDYVEMFRSIMLTGTLPSLRLFAACAVTSYLVFFLGYTYFMRNKTIIVDVL
jgi:lipopolysaccharide transport system permease protein